MSRTESPSLRFSPHPYPSPRLRQPRLQDRFLTGTAWPVTESGNSPVWICGDGRPS